MIAIADAPRDTAAEAIAALKELGVRPVMLSGDSRATAERIAAELGIDEVIAEVLPADKAAKVTELQAAGPQGGDGRRRRQRRARARPGRRRHRHRRRHRRRGRDRRRRADALRPARRRHRDHDQPRHHAQDAPEPRPGPSATTASRCPSPPASSSRSGFVLRPEVGAISMAGSSIIVAVNAVALKTAEATPARRRCTATASRPRRYPAQSRTRDGVSECRQVMRP